MSDFDPDRFTSSSLALATAAMSIGMLRMLRQMDENRALADDINARLTRMMRDRAVRHANAEAAALGADVDLTAALLEVSDGAVQNNVDNSLA